MNNNKFFKKILTILLISLITAATFAACNDDEDDNITTTTTDSDGETAPVNEVEVDGIVRLLPNLSDYDWGGYTFRVLAVPPVTDNWGTRDIAAEEQTGEPINDAVYKRNSILEEKYNFTIEQLFTDNVSFGTGPQALIRRAVAAGDNYFDAVSIIPNISASLAQEGLFVNLFGVPHLDFEKPWWDKSAVAAMRASITNYFSQAVIVCF